MVGTHAGEDFPEGLDYMEVPMMKQFVKPVERNHTGEICGGLCHVGRILFWSRERV